MNRWLFPLLYVLADILIICGILGTIFFLSPIWLLLSVVGLWKQGFYDRLKNEKRGDEE